MPYLGVRIMRDTRLIEAKLHGLDIPENINVDEFKQHVDKTVSRGNVIGLTNAELCQTIADSLVVLYSDKKEIRWAECHIINADGIMYGFAAIDEDNDE